MNDKPVEKPKGAAFLSTTSAERMEKFKLISTIEDDFITQQIIENLPSLIHIINSKNCILEANKSFCDFVSKPKADILSKSQLDILPSFPEQEQWLINDKNALSSNKVSESEEQLSLVDEVRSFHTIRVPIRWNKQKALCVIRLDVSSYHEVEEAFKWEKYLFETLMNMSLDLIYFKDLESKFLRVNQSWLKEWAKSDEHSNFNVLGKTDADFFKKDLAAKAFKEEQEIISSGKPIEVLEQVSSIYSSKTRTYSTKKMPLKNEQGEIIGTFGISRDITNEFALQKALKESEKKFRQIFDAAGTGICTINNKGHFIETNPSFRKITGYSKKDLTELTYFDLSHPIDKVKEKEIIKKRHKSGRKAYSLEKRIINKNGEITWVNTNAKLVFNTKEKIDHTVVILENINSRKRAEEKQEEYTRELQVLNKAKDRFLSIIAHDLKNPFNSLIGFSKLLVENYDKYDREKIHKFVKSIYISANQGHNLLVNLLDWSRSQTGKLDFEPENINIYNLINENKRLHDSAIQNKKLNFSNLANENHIAYADSNMVSTVLRNLLSNAVKFTPQQGTISVSTKIIDDRIQINISDTGKGIMKENLENLFKIDRDIISLGTENEKGTGLGLILCREFVEKNGGELWAQSKIGKGSTFSFTLPLK